MNIVLLCGSLEPGRDGVGDYVRRLAEELRCQGQQAAGLALYDPFITQEIDCTAAADTEVPVLRLPASWSAGRRFRRAQQWLKEFQPTWVSLQFVPYAFHPKGLPLFLGHRLHSVLPAGARVHIMMHEAWVGAEPGTGLKRQLLRQLQKTLIKNLIAKLQPAVMHTHLPIYRTRLERLGWQVKPLPLFSNIPVQPVKQSHSEPGVVRVGVFSQADTSGPFVDFLTSLATHVAQHRQRCQVLLIGGEPTKMQALGACLETHAELKGQVYYTGFMQPAQLSIALQTCQLGLTPVPRHGLGKSGSVAAFLAHGIPVAAPVVHHGSTAVNIGFFSASLRATIMLEPSIFDLRTAAKAAQESQLAVQAFTIAKIFWADLATQ
ncbi:MAG: glycosyltransferase family 1 protein [Hymenobacter sp.]|nr:MAG: glycosyltransferase family 1 protein [Hymenobacter sp.]